MAYPDLSGYQSSAGKAIDRTAALLRIQTLGRDAQIDDTEPIGQYLQ